ncbi:MAG: glycosyltransferase family 4 protein [Verrucomicrobiota bacterium JB022]|nr:glycosyltransferase family 4 protein [Verrucomicrobiota bacterium JB022]
MKIVVWQDHLRNGGTERQTLWLARHFQERQHAVELLLHRAGGRLYEQAADSGLKVRVLQPRASTSDMWAPKLTRYLQEVGPCVVLSMGRVANLYAGWVQLRCPKAVVVGTVRTGKALSPLSYWSLKRTRGVIANSEWWRQRLLRQGFAPEQVTTVYNSLLWPEANDAERRQQAREQLRAANGVSPETCVFLKVAGFRRGKRHRDLLQAFQNLLQQNPGLDCQLWLVGEGPETPSCQRWVRQQQMSKQVRFFGYQTNPQTFYAAADVAVSSSREDSLPNFLVEAQSSALPAVAIGYRGVAETFVEGESGVLIDQRDLPGMVAALQQLALDPELRRRMGEAAAAHAKVRFAPVPQADAVLRFLENRVALSGGKGWPPPLPQPDLP